MMPVIKFIRSAFIHSYPNLPSSILATFSMSLTKVIIFSFVSLARLSAVASFMSPLQGRPRERCLGSI